MKPGGIGPGKPPNGSWPAGPAPGKAERDDFTLHEAEIKDAGGKVKGSPWRLVVGVHNGRGMVTRWRSEDGFEHVPVEASDEGDYLGTDTPVRVRGYVKHKCVALVVGLEVRVTPKQYVRKGATHFFMKE